MIWLNGDEKYKVLLASNIIHEPYVQQAKLLENTILQGCKQFNMYYGGDDNLQKQVSEATTQIVQRKLDMAVAKVETKKKEQQLPPPKKIELTPDLTREVTFDDIADILSISIKRDKVNKLITFCAMLLAQTNRDQLNVGFQAESSVGKSYIPLELASYFPRGEIMKVASASPTSFYHKGTWDEDRKAQVCDLENKNLVFLDQPHFQLLERLRPVLSHDDKELQYYITDKNKSGAIRTKNIIIRGYPSVFFCTAKTDPDEQEKTRLILLSPSIDQEKLRESLELAALRNGNPEEYRKVIEQDHKRKWLMDRIYSLRQGGTREIIIPECGRAVYERFIKEHEHLKPRHQRDFPRIFSFIKAHTLLNCFNRERNGRADTVIANEADIEAGFALYKEIEASNELGLSPYIFRIFKEVIEPELSLEKGLSRKDIRAKYLTVFHKSLSPKLEESLIQQIEAAGLIQQEPDPDDKRKMLVYHPVVGNISPEQNKSTDGEDLEKYIPQLAVIPTQQANFLKIANDLTGDKGHFTIQQWLGELVFLPIQDPCYCNEDQAMQTLCQLIAEGKIIEFERDKYKPAQKLSRDRGA
jgi:hypothetical protein